MRTLTLALAAFGLVALGGVARADHKIENSDTTDTSTTLSGKHKVTRDKKMERADGSSVETKVETTRPKNLDKRDEDRATARHEDSDNNGVDVKTSEHTTLTGKKQMKTTKKVENPDGTQTETTTTRTEPKR